MVEFVWKKVASRKPILEESCKEKPGTVQIEKEERQGWEFCVWVCVTEVEGNKGKLCSDL